MVAPARPRSETDFFLTLWERQKLTAPVAKGVLKLGFDEEELARASALRSKNSAGRLSAEEAAELDAFVRASLTLSALQSQARQFLKAAGAKTSHA